MVNISLGIEGNNVFLVETIKTIKNLIKFDALNKYLMFSKSRKLLKKATFLTWFANLLYNSLPIWFLFALDNLKTKVKQQK